MVQLLEATTGLRHSFLGHSVLRPTRLKVLEVVVTTRHTELTGAVITVSSMEVTGAVVVGVVDSEKEW